MSRNSAEYVATQTYCIFYWSYKNYKNYSCHFWYFFQKVAIWACLIIIYWLEELIYIINCHHAVTSGLYRWTHIIDTPVLCESRHNEVPGGKKWPALLLVLYLCTFFTCFYINNVWQCVKRYHVIMRLYSYISGSRVVLELKFDTGQPANIISATLEAWWVQIYNEYKH